MDAYLRYKTAEGNYQHGPDLETIKSGFNDMVTIMSEAITDSGRAEITTHSPEQSVRLTITKNSKGYTYETGASVRCSDNNVDVIKLVELLIREVDEVARLECARRAELDAWRADSDAKLEIAFAAAERAS
jgi:hypothetical protein